MAARWDRLFADLEGQLDAADREELGAQVRDRTHRELARLGLADRLQAAAGMGLTLTVHGAGRVAGTLVASGPDWLALSSPPERRTLVPLAAVLAVAGLGGFAAEPGAQGAVAARWDLRYPLRRLAQDRAVLTLVLRDGSSLTGTLDGVGADFVEVAEHAPDEPRRAGRVRGRSLVPLAALALVRSG